ncbi:MAG: protein-glutamate O-methyltransferase CheR [Thermacetogeniaceae bacterium]
MNGFDITAEEFHLISSLVYDKFGINLGEHKQSLVIERLQKVLRQGGFSSFKEYYYSVMQDSTGQALLTLIDKISTNHTFFFRESDHFDVLTTAILPEIFNKQPGMGQSLRLWSAGCSSGEEPYSLAMAISESLGQKNNNLDLGILATDISVTALESASRGVYSEAQVSQVPLLFRKRYFTLTPDGNWAVKENLKKAILFRRLNLMRQVYPFKGKFQLIFCRNVMIYFDAPTRNALLGRFYNYLEPNGYLFVGHSESLDRSSGLFKYIKPAIYQKL